MDKEYSDYLNSEAWQQKRMQRLAISKFRCSACTKKKAVHVHHLTYERIFNEDMADLLPLCEEHHKAAEQLIAEGVLSRIGNALFLAAETMRLILRHSKTLRKERKRTVARNYTQEQLVNDPDFIDLLSLPRKKFKREVKRVFGRKQKVIANAFTLYDHRRKEVLSAPVTRSVTISTGGESRNGFKQPVRKWSNVSESQRHEAAMNRANGW